jgi:hypothetical protein
MKTENKEKQRRGVKLQGFDCYFKFLLDAQHQKRMNNGQAEQMKQNKHWFQMRTTSLVTYTPEVLSQYLNVDQRRVRRALRRLKRSKLIKGYQCNLNGQSFRVKVA